MSLDSIKTIAVAGAGTMGSGIAQLAAQAGYKVVLFDIKNKALQNAEQSINKNTDKGIEKGKLSAGDKERIFKNLVFTSNLNHLNAELVIEAILEKLDPKVDFFKTMHELNGEHCIFASNTSSIPITKIAAQIPNPERVVGMHFFNPAHIMKLVEVISGASTDTEVAETVFQLAEKMGKKPVHAKDAPGFIVNRVARHFYVESLKILEEQVTDHQGIDKLLKASGFKMGPFELMDLIGVDTNFSVTTSMYESFHYDDKFRPSRIQEQKVHAGHHGRKSGRGFYDYSGK
ncbi:MAG: 3-hydroxyacyl-CoA dehydrogenase NAD-binding domain-containing protein [Chitinophagales bacterium]